MGIPFSSITFPFTYQTSVRVESLAQSLAINGHSSNSIMIKLVIMFTIIILNGNFRLKPFLS